MEKENILAKFRMVIASLPDRENCVCEIYYEDDEWAEISHENEEVMIQFYSNPSGTFWEFPLEIVIEVLRRGKIKFLGSE